MVQFPKLSDLQSLQNRIDDSEYRNIAISEYRNIGRAVNEKMNLISHDLVDLLQ